jgi:hypothetical protein
VLQRLRVMGKGLWVQAGGVKRLPNGDDERLRGMVGAQVKQAKHSGSRCICLQMYACGTGSSELAPG